MKNAMIFGDSYSTFEGALPEEYASYYFKSGRPETNVTKIEETWWHQVITETGMNLVQNNSWSGSTIGYRGLSNRDTSQTNSFILRLRNLIREGFFEKNKIDTLFLFGGTNDSWSCADSGEMKFEDFTENDFYSVLPAICYFSTLLRETLREATIYCIINSGLRPEIVDCFEFVSEKYGFVSVKLDNIEKKSEHPTIAGMAEIKNQVMAAINEQE